MPRGNSHPTDQQLLLAEDGEPSPSRAAQIRVHLAACPDCRARMAGMERSIADFVRIHHQSLDCQLPGIAGSRGLLQSQMALLRANPCAKSWRRFIHFTIAIPTAAYVCLLFLITAIGGMRLAYFFVPHGLSPQTASFDPDVVPNRNLTPGGTRKVTVSQVCVRAHEEVIKAVPAALRQQVFREYGIVNARPGDYEIDYLIAPGLGGAEDIRNLWPEPYNSSPWNAHVKDALEERLYQLVCSGQLDLPTAQRDIATNWIVAYKKYFHTDKPLPLQPDAFLASFNVLTDDF